MIDISPEITNLLVLSVGLLLFILIMSFLSRAKVFTQYLEHMTGIKLAPRDVAAIFKDRGQAGVRDMFLELIIREDLKDGPRIMPDTPPDPKVLAPDPRR